MLLFHMRFSKIGNTIYELQRHWNWYKLHEKIRLERRTGKKIVQVKDTEIVINCKNWKNYCKMYSLSLRVKRPSKSLSISVQAHAFYWDCVAEGAEWFIEEFRWWQNNSFGSVRHLGSFWHTGPQWSHQPVGELVWHLWKCPSVVCLISDGSTANG